MVPKLIITWVNAPYPGQGVCVCERERARERARACVLGASERERAAGEHTGQSCAAFLSQKCLLYLVSGSVLHPKSKEFLSLHLTLNP